MFSTAGKRQRIGTACAAAALLLLGAAPGCARHEPAPAAVRTAEDWFPLRVGSRTIQVQVVVYPPEMERGLMFRRELGADQGMVFVYPEPIRMSFWMRNTALPLDIGFFNARGELKEVYAMLPFDETTIQSHDAQLQFALEMNQGWFQRNGIHPGAALDLAALSAAIAARGADPRMFGLR